MTESPLHIVRRPAPADLGDWPEHIPAVLRRVYAMRGCPDWTSAQPRLQHLHHPGTLSNIDRATALVAHALQAQQRILVVGDFDCDGASACALAVRGLRLLGAKHVSYAVPHRIAHGYGLSLALVAQLQVHEPELLITVDTGIACHDGVAAAKARGWSVLITDHHCPGATLPAADVIVNPQLPGDHFPSKCLAGVGVIFYVLLALRAYLRTLGSFPSDDGPDLTRLLDLVAVGTVADLVPLDANNRAMVAAGLRRLRQGQGCVGLQALCDCSKRPWQQLTCADIAYALAPRLNAAGRLEDMHLGVALLLSEQREDALAMARRLDAVNCRRRQLQQSMVAVANQAVSQALAPDGANIPPLICVSGPDWHPGIIGLIAAKLKEQWNRPVIALAPVTPGSDQWRGSARSIPGIHLRDVLATVHTRYPGLLTRFGGHAMAAGLELGQAKIARLQSACCAVLADHVDHHSFLTQVVTDGMLAEEELTVPIARMMSQAGPWGQGFPEPIFDGMFTVLDWSVVGQQHLRLSLRQIGQATPLTAMHFQCWPGPEPTAQVQIVYRLQAADYRGQATLQLIVVHRMPI